MIKDLVQKIHETEAAADKLVSEALNAAREINLNAELESAKIIDDTKKKFKAERLAVIESAQIDAEKKYNHILAIGKKEAEKLITNTDISAETEEIVTIFKERYVSR